MSEIDQLKKATRAMTNIAQNSAFLEALADEMLKDPESAPIWQELKDFADSHLAINAPYGRMIENLQDEYGGNTK